MYTGNEFFSNSKSFLLYFIDTPVVKLVSSLQYYLEHILSLAYPGSRTADHCDEVHDLLLIV